MILSYIWIRGIIHLAAWVDSRASRTQPVRYSPLRRLIRIPQDEADWYFYRDYIMRNKPILLLFLVILVALHGCITLVTVPEFHVLDNAEFQKHLDKISTLTDNSREVQKIELEGRWNGQYGISLAKRTLVIDAVMFLF